MKNRLFAAVSVLAVSVASHASAADLMRPPVYKAPPPLPAAYSWTGFYVGGQVGLVTSTMSADPWTDCASSSGGGSGGSELQCEGSEGITLVRGDMVQTLAGLHAGYNYQFNSNVVAGVEGDIDAKFGEGYFSATDLSMLSTWDASLRARLGVLLTPRSLLYATGGVAFGHFKTTIASAPAEHDFDLLAGGRVGWTVGGGVEYALDRNWSSRIEYRYTDWGSKTVAWATEAGEPILAHSTLKDQRVDVGLSYKFGGIADPFPNPVGLMPLKAPKPPIMVARWTGFYFGSHVGAVAGQAKVETPPFTETEDGETTTFESVRGGFTQILSGVHAGYNYQLPSSNLVAGIEGDINSKFGGGILYKAKSRPTSNWDGSIRARLGLLVTPRSLAYVTGGFAFGHFTTPLHEDDAQDTVEILGGERTGWTLGGGLEYALDVDWNTRIEYRYTDWGSKSVLWDDHPATSKLTDSRILVGLTRKVDGLSDFVRAGTVPVNWSGLYVGGQVGASAARLRFGPNPDDPEAEYSDFTQLLVGGHVGYNYQFGLFVVGAEGDLNAKLGNGFGIDDYLRPTSDWDASIRARFGIATSARGLFYVTGGYAFGNFTTPLAHTDIGDPDGEHIGGSRHGWTWGTGVQYALDQNWSARLEYRHTDWGTKMADLAFDPNPANLKDDRVAVGMSYRFSDWGNAPFGKTPVVAKY